MRTHDDRAREAVQRKATARPTGPVTAPPTAQLSSDQLSSEGILALQRLAGNRAVTSAITSPSATGAPSATGPTGPILPVQRHNAGKKHEHARGGPKTAATVISPPELVPRAPTTTGSSGFMGMMGSLGSWLWNKPTVSGEGEGEGSLSPLSKGQQEKVEFQRGEKEQEEPDPGLLQKLVEIPKLQIKLESETEGVLGKGKATGAMSLGATGGALKGKLEWEKDWIGGEKKPNDIDFAGGAGKLTAKGTLFGGAKAKGEFEATAQDGKYGSKGKLSAFAGLEAKGETEVTLKVAGKETKFKGALGVTVGVGGELGYHLTFAEGTLTWGTKGKLSLGLGGSFEYELTLPVSSIGSQLWSWLGSAGSYAWKNMTWENLEWLAGG